MNARRIRRSGGYDRGKLKDEPEDTLVCTVGAFFFLECYLG